MRMNLSSPNNIKIIAVVGVVVTVLLLVVVSSLLGHCKATCDPTPPCNTSAVAHTTVWEDVSSVTLESSDTTTMNSSTTNRTYEEAFELQQELMKNVPGCQKMYHAINVKEELDSRDYLHDKDLLPPEVPVYRCQSTCGRCLWGKRCLPTKKALIPVIVKYLNGDKTIYEERKLYEHQQCACQY